MPPVYVKKLRAERADLFSRSRAHIVCLNHGPKPPRRRNRLQAGDARTNHEHLGRGNRSGSRHQHGEESRKRIRCKNGSLVPGDGGH